MWEENRERKREKKGKGIDRGRRGAYSHDVVVLPFPNLEKTIRNPRAIEYST